MHVSTYFCCQSVAFLMSCRNLCKRQTDLGDDLDGLDPDTDHQELLQPVEWLQPSCTSGGTYNADADARSTETEGKIECPTCFKQFPIDEVSLHADECADAFLERVGGESEITLQNNVEDGLSQKDLKSKILQLRLRHLKEKEEAVRVTVRRKKIWDDFKRSRERYYTPDRILKVKVHCSTFLPLTTGPNINFLPLSSPLVPVSHCWTTRNWSSLGIHLFPPLPAKRSPWNDQFVQLKWEESNRQLHRGPQAGKTINRVCQELCHAVNLLCGACSNVLLQNQDLFGLFQKRRTKCTLSRAHCPGWISHFQSYLGNSLSTM